MGSVKSDLKSVHTDLRIGPTQPILNMTTKICLKFNDKKLFFPVKWNLFPDTYTATYDPFSWSASHIHHIFYIIIKEGASQISYLPQG